MAVDFEQRPSPASPPITGVITRVFNLTVLEITPDRIEVMARVANGPFRSGVPDTCPIRHGRINRETGVGWLGEKVDFPKPTPEQEDAAGGVFVGEEDARNYRNLTGLTWVFKQGSGRVMRHFSYPVVVDGDKATMIKFTAKQPTGKETNPTQSGDTEVRWDGNRNKLLIIPRSALFKTPVFTAHPNLVKSVRFIREGSHKGEPKVATIGTAFEDSNLDRASIKSIHWHEENGHIEYLVGQAERLEEDLFRIVSQTGISLDKFNQMLQEQGVVGPGVNGHGVFAATGKRVVYVNGGATAPNKHGLQETVMLLSKDDCDSYILSAPHSEVIDGVRHNRELPWKITPICWMN